MHLISVNKETYLYTDYSPGNVYSVEYNVLGEEAALVHSLNTESAVLNNTLETFHYNFKTGKKTHLTHNYSKTHAYGNRVFYVSANDLYFVNREGTRTRIAFLGNDFTGSVEDVGDFLMYRKTNGVGFLDKFSGKYMEFKISEGSGLDIKYLVGNGTPYLFTPTGIIRMNVEKGQPEITAHPVKDIRNPSAFGNKILFHEAFPDNEKSRVWCFEDGQLRVLLNELDIKGNGYQPLNQPTVFRNASTGNHAFWIPEKEKVFFFGEHDFSDNEHFSYRGFAGENHYFYSYNYRSQQWEAFLFNPVTEEFKAIVLTEFELHLASLFQDSFFYTTAKEIKQLAGTEQEVITGLVPVRVAGTGLFVFKNNLYVWARDENDIPQVYRLSDNEASGGTDVLLSAENPTPDFHFYPNPTADYLNISSTATSPGKYKITVFNTAGNVLSEKESGLPQKLDLSGLKPGFT
ncbi:MAG: T9SS type A sorting domain-containing protein [Leadbetterella sp.]|nr:T9SS type A sorting domain-containing protein [Leadbetterella sp.]